MNPHYISNQDIFNAAWQAFIVEKRPLSLNSELDCVYRGSESAKCAIGLCIPDELYDEQMEGGTPEELENKWRIRFEDVGVACSAQHTLHDQFRPFRNTDNLPEQMELTYREFAAYHNLEIPA